MTLSAAATDVVEPGAKVKDTFYVGLTMAGAISAGAYSAGVLDFLCEALDAWEARKRDSKASPSVPQHKIVIPVIAGASAGGITGALGAIAVSETVDAFETKYPQAGPVRATMPRLFRAWVKGPAFVKGTGEPAFLGVDDLHGDTPLASVLDTTVLEKIVKESLTGIKSAPNPKPYISNNLHLFLTQTNTRGVPYTVTFLGPDGAQKLEGYQMLCHADRVHLCVANAGQAPFPSLWADPERAATVDMIRLRGQRSATGEWAGLDSVRDEWVTFSNAALGTSAFPVGLSARRIQDTTVKNYFDRQWPLVGVFVDASGKSRQRNLEPDFPEPLTTAFGRQVPYVAMDGGTINNEPFELARWTLMEKPPQPNERTKEKADRAVIMVDPFPEPPGFDDRLELHDGLGDILRALLPTLQNQARFKVDDLVDALDEEVCSRFLIAPRRRIKTGNTLGPVEPYGIACGLLGGFGGFLDEELRAHDYQLGRMNCFYFLRDSFALPLDNDVIKAGYGAVAPWHDRFMPHEDGKPQPGLRQIIPVTLEPPAAPTWPLIDRTVVDAMVTKAVARGSAIVGRIAKGASAPWTRLLVPQAWKWFGQSRLEQFVRWTVMQDLIRRGQFKWPQKEALIIASLAEPGRLKLKGPAKLEDVVRLTLTALANPKFDFRTAKGIAKDSDLEQKDIETVLDELAGVVCPGPADAGAKSFTLVWRSPTGIWGNPFVRYVVETTWSGAPAVD